MSVLTIPTLVVKRYKKLRRDFLWGRCVQEFKYHLVASAQIKEGGVSWEGLAFPTGLARQGVLVICSRERFCMRAFFSPFFFWEDIMKLVCFPVCRGDGEILEA